MVKRFLVMSVFAASAAMAEFAAEDQTPSGKFTTAAEVRPIPEATRGSWIALREYEGRDWLYFTQMLSWRCGLHQIRYAINDGPLQVWEMPACQLDTATPNAFPEEQMLMISKVLELGEVRSVRVELLLDDLSEMSGSFERRAVLMP